VKRSHRRLLDRVNRLTLYVFAGGGIAAAVAGTLNVRWVKDNQFSIILFILSALLAYLLMEFTSIGDRLDNMRGRFGDFRTFDTSAPLYRAAAAALRETSESPHANKSVWIVSATGIAHARPAPPHGDPATREYYRALEAVMDRAGWTIRIIYNIESLERLDWVHDYLAKMHEATDLEARAAVRATREIIAPLIVGDTHIFLAQGDRRFHGVRAGIWINDPSANLFARNYFDSLWHAPELRVIRRATGLDETAFEAIREELLAGQLPDRSYLDRPQ
jgi:hypothetical protein